MSFDYFTSDQLAALTGKTVRCAFTYKFDFASGAVHAWNGNTERAFGGAPHKPMKGYGRMDGLGQSMGTVSDAVTLTLSGLPAGEPDFLAKALGESSEVVQRLLTISLQIFDGDWQTIGNPIPLFFGFMQQPKITLTPMQGTEGGMQVISLAAENIFFGRSRPPLGRYTDRDQQARSPDDRFFSFVSSLRNKTIIYPDW